MNHRNMEIVMKTDLKDYKFVVEIPSYGDVYDYCYKELENVENVYLIKSHIEFKNKYENWLYCHHFTNKFWLPFRGVWNSRYYNNPFNKNDKIIIFLILFLLLYKFYYFF